MPVGILIIGILFALSFMSGMLRLGVAFIAIPAPGLFGFELKDVIVPSWLIKPLLREQSQYLRGHLSS